MPLAALTESEDRVVAPDVPLATWDEWRANPRKRPAMSCRFCRHPMHPRTLESGTRFFAHNPGSECPFAGGKGESPEHLHTKTRVYLAVERTAWTGELEAHGRDPQTGEEYIIDVLAMPPDPRQAPWAYEVQLSPQSDAITERRTELCRRGHKANVTWLNVEKRSWFYDFPCVLLDPVDRWTVIDGVYREADEPEVPTPMDDIIARYHRGQYFWIPGMGYIDQRANIIGSTPGWDRPRRGNRRSVDDDCERTPTTTEVPRTPHPATMWTDDQWFLHSRMAHARRHARQPVTWDDAEAMSRYPDCPGLFDELPAARRIVA